MQRINEDIKSGNFKQVYLLCGEERYLRRQYTDRLKKALVDPDDTMNVHYYQGKDVNVGAVIDLAETMPFFVAHRVFFLENTGLFKSGGELLAQYLEEPCESSVFVFTENDVDKRSRLYKLVQSKGYVAECSAQDESTLKRWVASTLKKDGKRITESTVELFLQKTGTDMENISMELEKLICYCMDKDVVEASDVESICTNRIANHIFDMVSAVAEGRVQRAMKLYYDLLALKEPPMRILFLLARQMNLLLQTKELKKKGYDNKTMAARLGVPPFAVGKYLSQAARFGRDELQQALTRCVDAEEAVKTGRLGDTMSVELLLVSLGASGQTAKSIIQ